MLYKTLYMVFVAFAWFIFCPSGAASSEEDAQELFTHDAKLYAFVQRFGLHKTIKTLHALAPLYGDCHQPAHKAGRYAYTLYTTKAFRLAPPECHSGGLHGAIEAYFKEKGTTHLASDLRKICGPQLNHFFKHQCIHGIGHGLMAWADYKLPEALRHCDLLPESLESCYTGVFMEDLVGGLSPSGHEHGAKRESTKNVNKDPHYPCTTVAEKYQSACYFYQTSRMMALFNGDFAQIAAECAKAPPRYQDTCFESMGRDVGGTHRRNPTAAIQACSTVSNPSGRIRCVVGAVQDSFWDPTGQDAALHFCRLLQNGSEKDACYHTIIERARMVLGSESARADFCAKAESQYQRSCLRGSTSPSR